MTDFGRRGGDMLKSVYDSDGDGIISIMHTEADMTKYTYDPLDHGVVADSQKLEFETLAQVRDHTPKAHTHTEAQITDLDHDAQKIKGVVVDDTDKDNEKVLAFNSTTGNLEYEAMACEPVHIALLGTASADSIWSAMFSAAKANDGDPGTRWLSHFGAPHWWQVEWPTEKTIDYIEFTAAKAAYLEHFDEYYIDHWDGDDWVEDIHVTGYTDESPTVTHHDLDVSTTIIRIRTIGQHDRHGIYEVIVFGC